jgi:hypothetical protein
MHRGVLATICGLAAAASAGCAEGGEAPVLCSERTEVRGILFEGSDGGLSGNGVEFPVAFEGDLRLQQGVAPLPAPLSGAGYRMRASDVSEDLFLYVVREMNGLSPGATYRARFCATVATPLRAGGIGQRLYAKLGVSSRAPLRTVTDSEYGPYYFLDIDKGRLPTSGGSNAVYAGEVGRDDGGSGWGFVTREPQESLTVTADAQGRAWLLAGIESTFGGVVEFYWYQIEVELDEVF